MIHWKLKATVVGRYCCIGSSMIYFYHDESGLVLAEKDIKSNSFFCQK